jgi:hypothetical protein
MIKYFPKNKITVNQYTKGGEFLINGKDYIGAYYKTYRNKVYAGKNPIIGSSIELTPVNEINQNNTLPGRRKIGGIVSDDTTNDYINNPNIQTLQTFQTPTQYYPKPTDVDYNKGFIMRYFAKKRNENGFVIEIDKNTYQSLIKNDNIYDYITYQAIDLFWQITGPLKDDRKDKQYKVAGIEDTNKRLVTEKDKNFRGLIEYIGNNYIKYAKENQ